MPGGGGGGGFHAGGGGGAPFAPVDEVGSGGGGGGGAGFAAPVVTDVFGQVGVQEGNGVITLIYALAPQIAFSTDAPTTAVVGGSSYEVKATGTGTADVAYSVDPATTNDSCTLDGTTVSFVHAGSCVIAADQAADPDHTAGHATQSITVGRATQTITFDPLDATGAVGGTAELKATGGASGLPVVLSSSDTTVCTVSGTTLTFVAKGTCTVTATQDGDDDHTAAAPVDQDVTVDLVATTTKLTFDEDTPVYGQEVTATATVTGATEGTVQLFVDGDASGDPVVLGTDGKADLPLPDGLGAGGYEVKAVFTPADTTRSRVPDASATLPIGRARSKPLTVAATRRRSRSAPSPRARARRRPRSSSPSAVRPRRRYASSTRERHAPRLRRVGRRGRRRVRRRRRLVETPSSDPPRAGPRRSPRPSPDADDLAYSWYQTNVKVPSPARRAARRSAVTVPQRR